MPASSHTAWTATRFFELLPNLGRLRVISICGPSVFEALCTAGAFRVGGGALNMITPEFHWHLAYDRFQHLCSQDTVHERSGRRVLFFELREDAESAPFLRIYVYRPPKQDFDPAVEEAFTAAHVELVDGVAITSGVD